jgi:hypothetical protein
MNSTNRPRNEMIFLGFLALVAITLIIIALVPSLRNPIKELLTPEQRVILAKTSGTMVPGTPEFTIFKIQKKDQIFVEIYQKNEDAQLVLMASLPLEDRKDGHFLIQGNALNLALVDVDKDGSQEIVAPTYNDQLVPRLNVYRYNDATKSFDRATAPNDFQTQL